MTQKEKLEQFMKDELGCECYVLLASDPRGLEQWCAVKAPDEDTADIMCADLIVRRRIKDLEDPTDVDESVKVIRDIVSRIVSSWVCTATEDPIKALIMTMVFANKVKGLYEK